MKIGIASDHRGFQMKSRLIELARSMGHDVEDCGPDSTESVDYPDYAGRVASSVASRELDRGVLICGTGIGMCIAANKFPGVRAANCNDSVTAEFSRLHTMPTSSACQQISLATNWPTRLFRFGLVPSSKQAATPDDLKRFQTSKTVKHPHWLARNPPTTDDQTRSSV